MDQPTNHTATTCERLNARCLHLSTCPTKQTAPSRKSACWNTVDVPCCPKNDKGRCVFCTVYQAYLEGSHAPVEPCCNEPEKFAMDNKEAHKAYGKSFTMMDVCPCEE